MTDEQFIEDTLAEAKALNADLVAADVDTTFTEGAANEVVIEWVSQDGPLTLYICLSQNNAYLVSENGSPEFDMDVAEAKESIFQKYL